ncbi:hypothetical protein L3X38_018642 [Prunus dulcis]|uniref:Uncharacterized protein n=1 Tax=Prunus dulcis TaxID=3755 RepID=A0AAD4ZAY1_PRUDU|nr:hypothetical protein L3X38_018642 [Prunus dulcis]
MSIKGEGGAERKRREGAAPSLPLYLFFTSQLGLDGGDWIAMVIGLEFEVTGVVFVSAAATVVTLDCVSLWESCDNWWLIFCLCFNDSSSIDAGSSCWDVVLFFTLRRPKNYAWS